LHLLFQLADLEQLVLGRLPALLRPRSRLTISAIMPKAVVVGPGLFSTMVRQGSTSV